eukprot:UN34020
MDQVDYIWIDSPSQVGGLVDILEQESEIAIDLEHHSHRSYLGFTCLLQIGTRTKDFLVDTIELRNHLQPLNKVFANEKIVKVLHGAKMDIMWLQRDLGLYIVNMFDTHEAACALEFSKRSLAALLDHFCQIEVDKVYQLADWTLRPLPQAMIDYARSDVHYLLYVYDRLRNSLVEKSVDLIQTVYGKSTQICRQVYKKPQFNINRFTKYIERHNFDKSETFVFKCLCQFRDGYARKVDESVQYLESMKHILHITKSWKKFENNYDNFFSHLFRESHILIKHAFAIFIMVQSCIKTPNNFDKIICDTLTSIFENKNKYSEKPKKLEDEIVLSGPGILKCKMNNELPAVNIRVRKPTEICNDDLEGSESPLTNNSDKKYYNNRSKEVFQIVKKTFSDCLNIKKISGLLGVLYLNMKDKEISPTKTLLIILK